MLTAEQLKITTLGDRRVGSPLNLSTVPGDEIADYMPDDARVLVNVEGVEGAPIDTSLRFEKAGPREHIYFEPSDTRVAIVTCGGLCPGINNVIRSMVLELHYKYGVPDIIGFRYGYQGMSASPPAAPIHMTTDIVQDIHRRGGSILGTSRGAVSPEQMCETLERLNIHILFAIGGDGTLRGAHALHQYLASKGKKIAIVGVPKTIDNDVAYIDKTFGFDSAVEVAKLALDAAHTEAIGALNGVGLVKVMGRDSGFIAAAATLASLEVNYCLVPEVQFELTGSRGLLASLEQRLRSRAHALIVVAEGCGKALADQNAGRDASGNISYQNADLDIGVHLRDAIVKHFKSIGMPITLKYIDPSYMIRSVPANANDSLFCDILARQAVHAGMAGKTDLVIGRSHNVFTHVPLALATGQRKVIDPDSSLWLAVTETTGQPSLSSVVPTARLSLVGAVHAAR